jgi:protein fantom
VDDFFLHYLQKEKSTIELHQVIGSNYETKASCQLNFRELIDNQTSRIHGNTQVMSTSSNGNNILLGQLEYWVRLIVPVDEAFRLYKERTKALGYISNNINNLNTFAESKNKRKIDNNTNELNITIIRCSKVKSLQKDKQPSIYCVYRFYDFKDHDTEIIISSNDPQFNNHKSYSVLMDIDLDTYLKNESLDIFVFDDNDSVESALYLGLAKVPMISLAHDTDIKGTFELIKVNIFFVSLNTRSQKS